ncbi:MAG: hypothetical protein B6U95_00090 [Thermofilum sp. ex4484_82]|nr:MAG: hypothetical protein B6U95_00090 [Thermofilum sp. ex4484_82]OYT40129.1 MAG: hypothetical protein B6U96_00090 [Archaeoglobales archaeon ex4484_92]
MERFNEIKNFLQKESMNTTGVEAITLVSVEGLPLVSATSLKVDDVAVSAMTSAMLAIGEKASKELERGNLIKILVEGEKGYIVATQVNSSAILTVLTKKNVNLGLIFLKMKQLANKISNLLPKIS